MEFILVKQDEMGRDGKGKEKHTLHAGDVSKEDSK
jgi:hypothetical protein